MNKLNKGKLLGIVAAGLSTVSLMGVGFAAWVINGGANKDTDSIQITVAETVDHSITFDSVSVSEPAISFDAKMDDKTGPITGDGENDEDLNFSIEYTLTCADKSKFGGVKAYMTIADATAEKTAGKALADAISAPNNYLIAPLKTSDADKTTIASNLTSTTEDTNGDGLTNKKYSTTVRGTGPTYTFTTVFSFNWGLAFGNKNPSVYATESNKETVLNALKDLKDASNASFTIHLEAVSTIA